MEKLYNETELAEHLGVSLSTVRTWRLGGRGPRYIKLAGAVRYSQSSIQNWLRSRERGGDEVAFSPSAACVEVVG